MNVNPDIETTQSLSPKAAAWHAHIRAWGACGLTQKAYCTEHGLSLSSFAYWRKRYANSHSKTSIPLNFKALQVTDSSRSTTAERKLIVTLPNHVQIDVPLAGIQELRTVFVALGIVRC